MFLKTIKLHNFRNYNNFEMNFSKRINIIFGNNGVGKTNLLESIYVLGLTKSHRSFIDNNLIKNTESDASIKGIIVKDEIKTNYEVILGKNKVLKIDGDVIRKNSDYISKLNIIIFSPDDLDLVKGSPSSRRDYLDLELSQFYSDYIVILNEYNKLLKMRNDYLKKINGEYDKNYLEVVTSYLVKKASMIYIIRNKFINRINENSKDIYKNIADLEGFRVIYKNSYNFDNFSKDYLEEKLTELLNRALKSDIKNKSTSIGPHRDDLEFYIGDLNLKNYGSQGQQRIAVLALKLSELMIFKKYQEKVPILLLDDVFSELDIKKRNRLLKYVDEDVQVIITTTDIKNINKKIIKKANIIKL